MSHHTSPIVRRAETGCFATLSTSLVPSSITHNAAGCKCILAARRADKETIARMATNVRYALATGVFESDKPAVDFAMLLLGGDVVHTDLKLVHWVPTPRGGIDEKNGV